MRARVVQSSIRRPKLARFASTSQEGAPISFDSAREHCISLLREQDRSSYILQSYVPSKARAAFVAIRAFNLETSRIADNASKPELADLRFDFWKGVVQKCLASNLQSIKSVPAEPIAQLLAHAKLTDGVSLSRRFFITLLQTRQTFMTNPPFRNVDAMASYGEGTYSQLNYLTQEAMYSVSPIVSDFLQANPELLDQLETVAAHIGQGSGIATLLRGYNFFISKKRFVPLPVDLLAKHSLSQEAILRGEATGSKELADVVYETATRANDHMLSAQKTLKDINQSLDGTIPDAMFVPALTAIPVQLYLERLEKYNFDMSHRSLGKAEWRLPYRSYKAYKLRTI